NWEIQKWILEVEPDRLIVHLHSLCLLAQNLTPGAAIVFVAPFHIGGRGGGPLMGFCTLTQPQCRTPGVLGKLEALGQCSMIIKLIPEVLDQTIVQRHQEIVGAGCTVVLLRIEPARRDVGMPSKRELSFRCGMRGGYTRCQSRERRRSGSKHAA